MGSVRRTPASALEGGGCTAADCEETCAENSSAAAQTLHNYNEATSYGRSPLWQKQFVLAATRCCSPRFAANCLPSGLPLLTSTAAAQLKQHCYNCFFTANTPYLSALTDTGLIKGQTGGPLLCRCCFVALHCCCPRLAGTLLGLHGARYTPH